ncbi:MAG: NAD(P)-dependent oxidoreductase [Leptospiraceae bacterium]|nr:NAD(P)-dependent oxidoreductase [Leptospiraceae bacterium]
MIPIEGRKIALIGGAGFIGHNLALKLKQKKAEVSIIDSLQVNNLLSFTSTESDIANRELYSTIIQERLRLLQEAKIPLYIQDARDYHQLTHLITKINPQVVVVLAAVAHAGRSNKDPYSTFDHSFRTLENALDASRDSVEHFIYFSSSMVYGNFAEGVVTEDTNCDPIGIYGALKFGGEKLVIAYKQVFNLPFTIIRPSALYGERCVSRRVGQIFIENAMQGKDIIAKGDGSDKLDFTYIGDLTDGVVNVIQSENSKNQIFNLTYGQGRSLLEMIEILKKYFPEIKVHNSPRDSLMPERGTLSVEKAKKLIGYNPSNPLEIGFANYIEWYKSIFGSDSKYSSVMVPQIYE